MKLLPAATAVVLGLTLAACSDDAGQDDGRANVVTSFYPAAFLADRIGGDAVNVTTLTSPGAEPHDLELTAKQVIAINEADLVIHLSEFQQAVDAAIEDADRAEGATVDIGAGVTRLTEDEHDHEEHDHEEGGHEEHDHEGEHAEEEHDHDHGDTDPHVWLDPTNLIAAAGSVRDALTEADPDQSETYAANTEALVAELEALDTDFSEGLATCERTEFVTSHAAFSYLAHAYGLTQIPISGIDPHAEPSTATLVQITELVKSEGISTIFTERLASPALAKTVARETGAATAVLDPIEGLSDETVDEDYVSLMRQNLAALLKANDCT